MIDHKTMVRGCFICEFVNDFEKTDLQSENATGKTLEDGNNNIIQSLRGSLVRLRNAVTGYSHLWWKNSEAVSALGEWVIQWRHLDVVFFDADLERLAIAGPAQEDNIAMGVCVRHR